MTSNMTTAGPYADDVCWLAAARSRWGAAAACEMRRGVHPLHTTLLLSALHRQLQRLRVVDVDGPRLLAYNKERSMSTDIVRFEGDITERQIAVIERQAAIFAKSDLAGSLKGKSAELAIIGMHAVALGIPFTTAKEEMFVIPPGNHLTLSARLRVALARRAGHRVWFPETTAERCTCHLQRRGETHVHALTVTIHEISADLLKKDNWKNSPRDMLLATTARKLVGFAAQEVMLGIAGAERITIDYDDVIDEQPDIEGDDGLGELETGKPTEAQRTDLQHRIDALVPSSRRWLYEQAAGKIPNIHGPHLTVDHVDQLSAMLDQAARIDSAFIGAVPAEADPGRPFEEDVEYEDEMADGND